MDDDFLLLRESGLLATGLFLRASRERFTCDRDGTEKNDAFLIFAVECTIITDAIDARPYLYPFDGGIGSAY